MKQPEVIIKENNNTDIFYKGNIVQLAENSDDLVLVIKKTNDSLLPWEAFEGVRIGKNNFGEYSDKFICNCFKQFTGDIKISI